MFHPYIRRPTVGTSSGRISTGVRPGSRGGAEADRGCRGVGEVIHTNQEEVSDMDVERELMPDSIEELTRRLVHADETTMETWARILQVECKCPECVRTCVDSTDFANAAVDFYKMREEEEENALETVMAAVEGGAFAGPCSYCRNLAERD